MVSYISLEAIFVEFYGRQTGFSKRATEGGSMADRQCRHRDGSFNQRMGLIWTCCWLKPICSREMLGYNLM